MPPAAAPPKAKAEKKATTPTTAAAPAAASASSSSAAAAPKKAEKKTAAAAAAPKAEKKATAATPAAATAAAAPKAKAEKKTEQKTPAAAAAAAASSSSTAAEKKASKKAAGEKKAAATTPAAAAAAPAAAKAKTAATKATKATPAAAASPAAAAALKVVKPKGVKPDDLERSVSSALVELESNNAELKAVMRNLNFTAAKEVDVGGGKKAVVIFVPVPQLKAFHKVQSRLIRELEKKFSGKHVLFIAQRRIIPKPSRKRLLKQPRPRSRTLTAVHDAILEDLVFPTEIVGKRTRVKVDGDKLIKVFLDRKDQPNLDYKLGTFASVYKSLTGKDIVFEFPPAPQQE